MSDMSAIFLKTNKDAARPTKLKQVRIILAKIQKENKMAPLVVLMRLREPKITNCDWTYMLGSSRNFSTASAKNLL